MTLLTVAGGWIGSHIWLSDSWWSSGDSPTRTTSITLLVLACAAEDFDTGTYVM
mgnify:CR=1 FL=1